MGGGFGSGVAGGGEFCVEELAVFFEGVFEGGVGGEVGDLVGVLEGVVEFFGGAGGAEEDVFGDGGEGACGVGGAQGDEDGFGVFVGVGLEVGTLGVAVADVEEAVGADGAEVFGGFVTAVACGEDFGAGGVVFGEEVAALDGGGDGQVGGGEGGGGEVDLLDEVVADGAFGDAGAAHDEGDVGAFVVEELFAAGVGDAVVGHEDDEGVFEQVFFFEAGDDLADVMVGEADGI